MSDAAFPAELRGTMRRAIRLEWWNVGFSLSIVLVMGLVLGQSQTMKTAWAEDLVGLVPPVAFLVAAHLEMKGRRSRRFPFGFARANGLGFFAAAVALATVGLQLLWDAVSTLVAGEHASVGSVVLFGHELWLGWLMLAAQLYSLVPPFIIGRLELPLARRLNDKLLHTDALMNKANWMTGAAGIAGIVGLGLGYWWADSVAAALISVSIIKDGYDSLRSAAAELIDGTPRALADDSIADDARALEAALAARFPGADIRLRETGRVIHAEVHGAAPPADVDDPRAYWPGDPATSWRLAQLTFAPATRDEGD